MCIFILRMYILCVLILCIYIYDVLYDIYMILYTDIHIKGNYVTNRIYEKTFRSDLSTQ